MRTAVVLLSVDEAHHLASSLPAAAAQEGAEVLVVDNASTDGTAELAAAHGARVLRLEPRRSYAAAVNAGIAATDAHAVLLLNADCVLAPGFLRAARPRLEAPGIGAVAPKLLQLSGDRVDAAGMWLDRRRKNGLVGHGAPADAYGRPGEAFGADGAAALYRREVLEACALDGEVLDEDLGLWASDADLAWRAQLLGWRCAYEPGAVAHHKRTYSPSTRAQVDPAHRRLQFANRYLMWVKNETGAGLARDLPAILLYEFLALGHVLLRERALLAGYADAWRGLAGARRRRRVVQTRRRVDRVPFGLRPPA